MKHRFQYLFFFLLLTLYTADSLEGNNILIGCPQPYSSPSFKPIVEAINISFSLWAENVNLNGGFKVGNSSYNVTIIFLDCGHPNSSIMSSLTTSIMTDLCEGRKYGKVDFLFSPYSSTLTPIAAAIAEKYGIPMISGHAANEDVFTCTAVNSICTAIGNRKWFYTVGVSPPSANYFSSFITLMKIKQAKTLAVFWEPASFTVGLATGVINMAENNKIKIVYQKQLSTITNQTQLLPIVKALKDLKPDVVIGGTYDIACRAFIEYAEQLNFSPSAVGLSVCVTNDLIDDLKNSSRYIYGPSAWDDRIYGRAYTEQNVDPNHQVFHWITQNTSQTSAKLFASAYTNTPAAKALNLTSVYYYQASAAYAMGYTLHEAIRKSSSLDSEKVMNFLRDSQFDSFYGPVAFNSVGMNVAIDVIIVQISQKGSIEIVTPLSSATMEAIYPMPEWNLRSKRIQAFAFQTNEKIIFIFCGILLFCCITLAIILILWKEKPQILASNVMFCFLIILGSVITYVSVILNGLDIPTNNCKAHLWLLLIGVDLVIGSLLFKNWRIYILFRELNHLRKVTISNLKLFIAITVVIAGDFLILILWEVIDPVHSMEIILDSNRPALNYGLCYYSTIFVAVAGAYKAILLLFGGWLAFQLRNVASQFNESTFIGYCIYNCIFSLIVLLIIWQSLGPEDYNLNFLLRSLAVMWGATATLGCMFLPKLYYVYYNMNDPALLFSDSQNKTTESDVAKLLDRVAVLEIENEQLKIQINAHKT